MEINTAPDEKNDHLSIDGLTIGAIQSQVDVRNGMHYHDQATICFLLQGGGVEKRKNHEYERFANDARFYCAGEPHQSDIRIFPSKCINLEFGDTFLKRYDLSESIIGSAVRDRLEVKFAMIRMYSEYLINDTMSHTSIEVLLLGLLANEKQFGRKRPEWLQDLREILNEYWADNIRLNDLSSILNVHPVTISKYFTKYFSCTLGEYARRLKVNKSLSLIKHGQLPLTEIALQCGFTDQSHFIRNFKRQTGLLPKQFRRL